MSEPYLMPNAPGFYYGVSFEDYAKWPAVSISLLKEMGKTPLHAFYRKSNRMQPTEEMQVGSAAHCRILEPDKWDSRFYVCPPCKRNTKDGKAIYAEAEAAANGRTILRLSEDAESASAIAMAESVSAHALCGKMISDPGQSEVSALWYDEMGKQWCKGRFDKLIPGDINIVLEIKTSARIDDYSFSRTAKNLHYDAQAAWYLWGLACISGETAIHQIMAVESKPPFSCRILQLADESIEAGATNYTRWYLEYCQCAKSGLWPGYPSKVQNLILPNYTGEELELTISGKTHAL